MKRLRISRINGREQKPRRLTVFKTRPFGCPLVSLGEWRGQWPKTLKGEIPIVSSPWWPFFFCWMWNLHFCRKFVRNSSPRRGERWKVRSMDFVRGFCPLPTVFVEGMSQLDMFKDRVSPVDSTWKPQSGLSTVGPMKSDATSTKSLHDAYEFNIVLYQVTL